MISIIRRTLIAVFSLRVKSNLEADLRACDLVLIPLFLTKEAQGYWFTIMSLAALVMLADLGFSSIITQFAAHEFAFLRLDDHEITGSEQHLNRLATFFVFSTKWALGHTSHSISHYIIGRIYCSLRKDRDRQLGSTMVRLPDRRRTYVFQ